MGSYHENLPKWRLNGSTSPRHVCLVSSIRCHIDLFFTETCPYYNFLTEVLLLILTYVAVINLFNISLCSKFCYACAHNNERLDEKICIKRLITNYPVFGFILRALCCLIMRTYALNFKKIILKSAFCLLRKSC